MVNCCNCWLVNIILSHPIAAHWVKAKDLSIDKIQHCVMLMGAVFAFQFPSSVYEGAFTGLQKQAVSAIINFCFTTLKAVGVLIVLKYISPDIESYFIWQAVVTLLFTFAMRWYVRKNIGVKNVRATFSTQQLKTIWRFAAGMAGISLVTFFLVQIDKIVVSKMLLLEYVGYYNLAFLLASGINAIISPMQSIVYPKLTQLVATNNMEGLVTLYHKACKWISIIVFPVGFTLIFFAKEILFLWTKNTTLTNETAPILQVCAAGTICNCLMWIPHFVLLAKGNTKFGLYQNTIASIVLVPLLFWWTSKYGALGASFVWLAVNVGIVLISIPLFHHLYLKKEIWNWFKNDVFIPLLVAVILVFGARYFQQQFFNSLNVFTIVFLLMAISILYVLIIPETKAYLTKLFFLIKRK
ncbi:MAG: oligosaccharide flippase family protein [Chitinophagaceae bacterium]|nr:oligosaccharide flippase family protein [Chitinophagaceae bacterium]